MAWFDAFWQLYPRHVGKQAALKAWKKAATSEAIKDEIMAGVKRMMNECKFKEARFIPHASTWLNGRRWEDEVTHVPGAGHYITRRVIACERCGDSGIAQASALGFARCSCDRGQLPGLVIPQPEGDDPPPF